MSQPGKWAATPPVTAMAIESGTPGACNQSTVMYSLKETLIYSSRLRIGQCFLKNRQMQGEIQMQADVLAFWFNELEPARWWQKDQELDREIAERFGSLHARAAQCELYTWRETAAGRLAEIIVLDQFSRNIYRDTPAAFACDPLALGLAQEAVAAGADDKLTAVQQSFLYMPYMHSESLAIHEQAVRLYSRPGLEFNLDFELRHQRIIERFGRYPHRNAILGRESTAEEIEFLGQPGSSF